MLALGVQRLAAQGPSRITVLAEAYLARNVEVEPRSEGDSEARVREKVGGERGREQPSRGSGSPGTPKGGLRESASRSDSGSDLDGRSSKRGGGQGALRGGDVGVPDDSGGVARSKLDLERAVGEGGGAPGAGRSEGAHGGQINPL